MLRNLYRGKNGNIRCKKLANIETFLLSVLRTSSQALLEACYDNQKTIRFGRRAFIR